MARNASTKLFDIKVLLINTREVFTVTAVSNKTEIRLLKIRLELIAGIPSHLQRIMYLDQGDMEDDSTFKHHDVVPGAQLSLHIWNAWLSLIQACCNGNVKEVMSLGVTPDSTFSNPNVERMSVEVRRNYFAARSAVALYVACHRGQKDLVTALLNRGADMSAITKYGRTALHVAAANGKEVIVDLLLEHGGGKLIEKEDTNGENSLQVATVMGHKACARKLFLFQWRKRAAKMTTTRPSDLKALMAHQMFDSSSRTWLRGTHQQLYHGKILPPQEFQGTGIGAKRSCYSLDGNGNQAQRRKSKQGSKSEPHNAPDVKRHPAVPVRKEYREQESKTVASKRTEARLPFAKQIQFPASVAEDFLPVPAKAAQY